MAKQPKQPPQADPVVAPEAAPVVAGPVIVFMDGADKDLKFPINPKASRYVVLANGIVMEDL